MVEFLFFSFSLIFQKRDSSRSISLWIFQNFLTKAFLKTSSTLLLLWLPNLSQQTKAFSKLKIKQPILWYLYYVTGHVFTCLTRKIFDGVFLRKVSGFSYKQNTVDNYFAMKQLYHIFTWKNPHVLLELFFHKSPGWLLLKVLQQIRPCSNLVTKRK